MAKTVWGVWELNKENACLEYVDPDSDILIYQVPIDEMTTSAEILDWIFQIEEKSWATKVILGEFISAIVDILGRAVCGGGIEGGVDPKERLKNGYGVVF